MFEMLILIVAIHCVGALVYFHATARNLPPKAQLVCDIWKTVEKNSEDTTEKRATNYTYMSSII